jgi:hypothetical protein
MLMGSIGLQIRALLCKYDMTYSSAPPTSGDAAMIEDIVVNLSVGGRARPAGDYAVSIAATFDAHVAGIAFIYNPIVPGSGAGYIPAEVFETQQRDSAAATKAAIDRFAAASARAGVSAEPRTLSINFAGAGDQFGRIARHFDLSVVGQAEPERSAIEENIVEAALFDSGLKWSGFGSTSIVRFRLLLLLALWSLWATPLCVVHKSTRPAAPPRRSGSRGAF